MLFEIELEHVILALFVLDGKSGKFYSVNVKVTLRFIRHAGIILTAYEGLLSPNF